MTYIRFQTLEPNTNDSIVKTERLNKNNKIINIKRCTKTPAFEARATHQETLFPHEAFRSSKPTLACAKRGILMSLKFYLYIYICFFLNVRFVFW